MKFKDKKIKKIFVIIGKSSTGKDTIFKELLNNKHLHLFPIITYTTRPIRDGEEEGLEYHFVNDNTFNDMKDKVVEYRRYNTKYGVWTYFTFIDIENIMTYIEYKNFDHIIIGTVEQYKSIKKYFEEKEFADTVIPIYIDSNPYNRILRSINRERNNNNPKYDEICRRYLTDEEDFSEDKIDDIMKELPAEYRVKFNNNDKLNHTVKFISEYIQIIQSKEKDI